MAIPNAPQELGGSKLMFMLYDLTGTNTASLLRSISEETVNSETFGHLAVGSHVDGDTDGGSEPGMLIMGSNDSNIYPLAVDSAGRLEVIGASAHGAAAAGNVFRAGGVYRTSDPVLDNGDLGDIGVDVGGRLKIVGPAADDAAVIGNPILIGGTYQATPDAIDDGDVGRLRSSIRRALISGADIYSVAMASAAEIRDTDWHWYTLDIDDYGGREVAVMIENTHNVATDVAFKVGTSTTTIEAYAADADVPVTTGEQFYGPEADAGSGGNYIPVPAFRSPFARISVGVQYDSGPASGDVTITAIVRS